MIVFIYDVLHEGHEGKGNIGLSPSKEHSIWSVIFLLALISNKTKNIVLRKSFP
jgi:hypothetical protein